MNTHNKPQGFSLIELMVVVAIIGIVTAIAIPQYQSHVATSDVLSCHREISSGRVLFEIRINDGETITADSSLASINVAFSNACARHAMTENTISGVVKGNALVDGAKINLVRNSASGAWSCNVSDKPALWTDDFLPADCN